MVLTPMRRFAMAVVAVLLAALTIGRAEAPAARAAPKFQPPEVIRAADVHAPLRSIAYGTVVLEATIGTQGEVESVRVVRDVASLSPAAAHAVERWRFRAATYGGKPVRSRITLAFTFNPAVNNPVNTPLEPRSLPAVADAGEPHYRPPDVAATSFPEYPIRSVAWGAVTLELALSPAGRIENVRTVRDVASLTPEAVRAVKQWSFTPAELDGRPFASKLAVCFVFTPPHTGR